MTRRKSEWKIVICLSLFFSSGWGFYSHKEINRIAVFTLPPQMLGFYKKNIRFLSEAAVDPDRRRYAVADEAPRHFIDLDRVDSCLMIEHSTWTDALEQYPVDSLLKHGIVPWHLVRTYYQLREAFMLNDPQRILRLSADLGHYAGDASVPLHTTSNYNGQQTGQVGIHGFWESRLPELFHEDYDFFVGKAEYLDHPQITAWKTVQRAHRAVDSVLNFEAELSAAHAGRGSADKYNYESRGKQTIRVYSFAFSRRYHVMLNGMVERQFRSSIKLTGDLWFTAWVDAGQPDLNNLIDREPTAEEIRKRKEELELWKTKQFHVREHETEP